MYFYYLGLINEMIWIKNRESKGIMKIDVSIKYKSIWDDSESIGIIHDIKQWFEDFSLSKLLY